MPQSSKKFKSITQILKQFKSDLKITKNKNHIYMFVQILKTTQYFRKQ